MADTSSAEPLSLDEVKVNLRVSLAVTSEDDIIGDLITDAREYVEAMTGLVLVPRTITETTLGLGRWIELTSWPVTGVTAIRYPGAAGLTTLPTAAWQFSLTRRPVRLLPVAIGWGVAPSYAAPGANLPVEIDVEAGYADPVDIPRRAIRAMHMLIAHWYENRQTAEVGVRAAAIEVPFGVTEMLRTLKLSKI